MIVVAAARQPSAKIPWVDQRDAAVAAAMNILLATHALGFGGMWRTGENCDDEIKLALGRARGCHRRLPLHRDTRATPAPKDD